MVAGTVFQLTPGTNGTWKERVLHSFHYEGKDGYNPYSSLIFGAEGKGKSRDFRLSQALAYPVVKKGSSAAAAITHQDGLEPISTRQKGHWQ